MPKIMLNGIEYASGIDHQKLLKIGDAPLDTTADNLSDAVNELNTNLSQLQVYSTSEVNTGMKWIDGKTIYRKTYTGNCVSNATIDLETITFNTIVHAYGWARSDNNNSWGIPSGRQDGYENRWLYNVNTKKLSVQFGSAYLNNQVPFVFTVEYTKP